jgi:polysaccharide biosynthesis PFTS motif protein
MKLLKKHAQRGLRGKMRGYRRLKESGQLDSIMLIKELLSNSEVVDNKTRFSKVVLGAGRAYSEIALRQYLLIRVVHKALSQALLSYANKHNHGVKAPLPRAWRSILRDNGYKVSELTCALLWWAYAFAHLGFGTLQAIRTIIDFFRGTNLPNTRAEPYIYFCNLNCGNLPSGKNSAEDFNIIKWLLKHREHSINFASIRHDVSDVQFMIHGEHILSFQPSPLPRISGWTELLRFTEWLVKVVLICVIDFFRGRWWHCFLLNEAVKAARVRFSPRQLLAKEYFFSNSCLMYRPLWTYEAESKGVILTYYFYSTNSEFKQNMDGTPYPNFGYNLLNWPNYLVWDEFQADFVRRYSKSKANIDIVGPIWFQDGGTTKIPVRQSSIAVFDVQPHRSSIYRTLALPYEYYVPEVVIPFLADIGSLAKKYNKTVLFKGKRDIGRKEHPAYRSFLNKFLQEANVDGLDPAISAFRVINAVDAVVSLPFTSTAHIAKAAGKPSVYYDPIGAIREDDPAAHGIRIIRGSNELARWLQSFA